MEDQEILLKFRDPAARNVAFNQLVRKYQQRVYWHVRKMVIDHDDADDLVQDVFVKVWNNLENFRADASLYTWIYRIATNECLNFLQSKRRKFFLPLNDVGAELSAKLEADDSLAADEVELKLQKAILRLPDKQRMVFNLRYYDEMPYEQMAEVTGTSVGALKASYHHAVKKIEQYVNEASH
ncbi:sigma-70 family RNA polymerase sigma factor [Hymenobacter oligotrophus]|uniref:RNA polymerase sigma factor n=1 Tax=Hymenobacter oligotrophus TaxID=2319843 RepID=A0A3B7R454_9BACT|nr:sigma-70 family RNA polymerase sigma factor [Hymenobacter oligotrophus]AYA36109.1 sigma-70 family RNA polymerase sigma factor [Hymenobacter oligotrophus]